MLTRWTTAGDDDPRLLRTFRTASTVAVAAATVDGVRVWVTTTDSSVDDVLQIWHSGTGELLRVVPDVGGDSLVVTSLAGRPVAVVCGWSDTPRMVDLSTGTVSPLPAAKEIAQGLAIAGVEGAPALVTADLGGKVRLIDLTDPSSVREFDAGADRLNAVAVLECRGRLAVVAAGDSLHAWDLATGDPLPAPPISGRARAVATWPDAPDLLAVLGMDGTVELAPLGTDGTVESAPLDMHDTVESAPLDMHDTVESAPLDMDGTVEIAGRGVLGVPRSSSATHLAGVVTTDGRRLLAVADAEAVVLWDVEANRAAGPPLVGPTGWAGICAGGPGELITASAEDCAVSLWSVGAALRPTGHGATSTITALALSPDGWVIAGGSDGTVTTWSVTDGSPGPGISGRGSTPSEHGSTPSRHGPAIREHGPTLGGHGTTPGGHGSAVGRLRGPVRVIVAVGVGGRIEVLAGGGDVNGSPDDLLYRWVADPAIAAGRFGADRAIPAEHSGEVRVIAPYGTSVFTAGCDQTIARIDLVTGSRIEVFPGDHHASGVAIRGDRAAVSRFPSPFQLWDLITGKPIPTAATDSAAFGERVVGWCGDDRVVVALDEATRVRDLTTGETIRLDEDNDARITAIACADRSVAVARDDCSLSLFDPDSGLVTDAIELPYPATACAWTPDGDLIVACRRDLIRLSAAGRS
ncbi:WD40 repeat domain-containing protein [Actinoplanes sp. NBRC 103695]|uniref:WD40 repeat domain-containing protein n=1 Tax=Actinoplanes sp. NBRC 103695 TaxID=3032202 RepID=UPI0024A5ECA3|nr:WD40 repeat domain-containing protein [Actinoplanes sp. NBRC 103695]GLZ01093.1 hypothetical protein Acsp02_83440 [Actinoplanes sp. NBRC 103695]